MLIEQRRIHHEFLRGIAEVVRFGSTYKAPAEPEAKLRPDTVCRAGPGRGVRFTSVESRDNMKKNIYIHVQLVIYVYI